MDASSELTQAFLSFSREKLVREMWPRLRAAVEGLSNDQIWWRPNDSSNSIGNLLLHLNGNVRQWILQGLGSIENVRDRDAEFNERGSVPLSDLVLALDRTLHEVDTLLENLSSEDLLRQHEIQVYRDVPAIDAIYHVVEHFAMHYGQILYISKLLRAEDLGFYAHLTVSQRSGGRA
jgi:uncharacterized damage-inducible protein DinB